MSSAARYERQPIYFGWWVLAAGALTEMLAIGSTSYSAGLFVLPLQREFSLSRAAANSALPISLAGAALMAPLVGYFLDRYRAERVIAFGAICICLGFSLIAATTSLPIMVAALLIPVAFGGMAIGPLTTSTLASRWFYRRRGRALGIAAVATSGGGIVVAPLLGLAIESYGWRAALIGEAILIALIAVILAVFVIRSGPADHGLEGHIENARRPRSDVTVAEKQTQEQWTYRSILSSSCFWFVGFVLAAISGIDQAIVITLVPYGSELGFASASVIFLITLFSVTAAIVKVTSGFLAEFVDRRMIMIASTLAMVMSLSVLLVSDRYLFLAIASCLAGASLGGVLPSSAALIASSFGSPSFGRAMGMIYVAVVLSSVFCVRFIGMMFDRTGGYGEAFAGFISLAIITVLAALMLRVPQGQNAQVVS